MQTAQEKGYSQSAALLAHEDAAKGGSIFKLHSEYKPTGDQPQAIEALVKGFQEVNPFQTLLYGEFKEFFPENAVEYFVS